MQVEVDLLKGPSPMNPEIKEEEKNTTQQESNPWPLPLCSNQGLSLAKNNLSVYFSLSLFVWSLSTIHFEKKDTSVPPLLAGFKPVTSWLRGMRSPSLQQPRVSLAKKFLFCLLFCLFVCLFLESNLFERDASIPSFLLFCWLVKIFWHPNLTFQSYGQFWELRTDNRNRSYKNIFSVELCYAGILAFWLT